MPSEAKTPQPRRSSCYVGVHVTLKETLRCPCKQELSYGKTGTSQQARVKIWLTVHFRPLTVFILVYIFSFTNIASV